MEERLPKVAQFRKAKRIGRGFGSGKGGHTVGRGTKGQKARTSIGVLFEGIKVKKSLLKKIPLQRGKDKFKAHPKPIVVKIGYLNIFNAGSVVDLKALIEKRIVDSKDALDIGVKVLGDGKLEKKLTVRLPISKSAAKQIEKAGGKVEPVQAKTSPKDLKKDK